MALTSTTYAGSTLLRLLDVLAASAQAQALLGIPAGQDEADRISQARSRIVLGDGGMALGNTTTCDGQQVPLHPPLLEIGLSPNQRQQAAAGAGRVSHAVPLVINCFLPKSPGLDPATLYMAATDLVEGLHEALWDAHRQGSLILLESTTVLPPARPLPEFPVPGVGHFARIECIASSDR